MERLTERNESGQAYYKKCFEEPCNGMGERDCDACEHSYAVCERLAEYEDLGITPEQVRELDRTCTEKIQELAKYQKLEEDGLLLRLPCKVGDTVYAIVKNLIVEDTVADYDVWSVLNGLHLRVRLREHKNYVIGEVGKDIFLTKEEAEQALKRLESET